MFIVNPYIYGASYLHSLRQLKTGVTSVVRVRRSGDNAESDFTADEITDGTLTTWTGANDGFVVTWYDQSGNANDVTQGTASAQPQIVSSGSLITMASGNGILFDGSNDKLKKGSAISAMGVGAKSVFAVVNGEDGGATANGSILGTYQTGSTYWRMDCDNRTNKNNIVVYNGSTFYVGAELSTQYSDSDRLLVGIEDGSKNLSAFDNGNTGGTDTYTGTYINDDFVLGDSSGALNINNLQGTIGEVIIFGTDESANRTAIESDINTYYSIY
jgi:hypothetical protein